MIPYKLETAAPYVNSPRVFASRMVVAVVVWWKLTRLIYRLFVR